MPIFSVKRYTQVLLIAMFTIFMPLAANSAQVIYSGDAMPIDEGWSYTDYSQMYEKNHVSLGPNGTLHFLVPENYAAYSTMHYNKTVEVPSGHKKFYVEWDAHYVFATGAPYFAVTDIYALSYGFYFGGLIGIPMVEPVGSQNLFGKPTPLPLTDGFHTYRIEFEEGGWVRLLQDGFLVYEEKFGPAKFGNYFSIDFGVLFVPNPTPDLSYAAGEYYLDEIRIGTDLDVPTTPVNTAPIADAGVTQQVTVGGYVCLDGVGTDYDGDPLSYSWQFTNLPLNSSAAFDNPNSASACFTADVEGEYIATLIVNDGTVDSLPSSVSIDAIPTQGGGMSCSALQTQLDAANAMIGQLTNEVNSLNTQIASQTDTINLLTQQRDSLQQQVDTLTAENAALSQQVADLTQQVNGLNQQVSDLTQQVNGLNQQIAFLEGQVMTLTDQNTVLTQQLADLQNQYDQFYGGVVGSLTNLQTYLGMPISGSTPEEQLANLVTAIQQLNPGRLNGLKKLLGN